MADSEKEWQLKLKQWQAAIDDLSQRERVLVFLIAVVFIGMLLQVFLLDPVLAERKQLQSQTKNLKNQISQLSSQQTVLSAELAAGIDRNKIKQRDQLQKEVESLNKKIEESVVAMIPPKLMAEVLEQLLAESKGLKLLSLENKPVVALVDEGLENIKGSSQQQQKNSASRQALYNHSFVLQLSGSYMDAIQYFERLSKLPWRFYWDDLKYEVDIYPNAKITLEVHTVSMSEEWIGV